MAKYLSTKTYGNDRGLSCCFRQWRSTHSHCSLLHGYSIGIKLIFESETLDDRNWVMDFGGLKAFKEWSEWQFDHRYIFQVRFVSNESVRGRRQRARAEFGCCIRPEWFANN